MGMRFGPLLSFGMTIFSIPLPWHPPMSGGVALFPSSGGGKKPHPFSDRGQTSVFVQIKSRVVVRGGA